MATSLGGEHLEVVDEPVLVGERLRLRRDVRRAAGVHLGARGGAPHAAGPVTAEGDVEDLALDVSMADTTSKGCS